MDWPSVDHHLAFFHHPDVEFHQKRHGEGPVFDGVCQNRHFGDDGGNAGEPDENRVVPEPQRHRVANDGLGIFRDVVRFGVPFVFWRGGRRPSGRPFAVLWRKRVFSPLVDRVSY